MGRTGAGADPLDRSLAADRGVGSAGLAAPLRHPPWQLPLLPPGARRAELRRRRVGRGDDAGHHRPVLRRRGGVRQRAVRAGFRTRAGRRHVRTGGPRGRVLPDRLIWPVPWGVSRRCTDRGPWVETPMPFSLASTLLHIGWV